MWKLIRFKVWIMIVFFFCGKVYSQVQSDYKQILSDSSYYYLGLKASTNANVLLIYVADYNEMLTIDTTENFEKKGWIYLLVYNIDINKVLLKIRSGNYDILDLKEVEGNIVFDNNYTLWGNGEILSGDTLFLDQEKGINIITGKELYIEKAKDSRRFWKEGGSLPKEVSIFSQTTKNFNVVITKDHKRLLFIKHFQTINRENDSIIEFTKRLRHFHFSQKTNLFSDNPIIDEFLSFEIGNGDYHFSPLSRSLFFHYGGGWAMQNIRLLGHRALVGNTFIEKHQIRTFAGLVNTGITKAFGNKDKYFVQIQLQGGFNFYTRYSYWDQSGEKHKRKRSVLNRWNYGTKIIFGRGDWAVFTEYRLCNLFKTEIALSNVSSFSIGLEFQSWYKSRAPRPRGRFYRLK